MHKLRILIVSRAIIPMISPRAYRTTELARELSRLGHEVCVLTHKKDFDYSKYSNEYNVQLEDFVFDKWVEINGLSILHKGLKMFLDYFFMFPDIQIFPLLLKSLKNKSCYDLLISIAVPYSIHWAVAVARNKTKNLCKVWIADCGDPFLAKNDNKFKYPFYFRLVDKWFCKKPDYLTIPIREAIKAYPKECRYKIHIIPQGFNFEDTRAITDCEKKPYLIFGYAGTFSKYRRDPKKFLYFLASKTDLKFKFIVYTKSVSHLKQFIHTMGEKLEIRDYVPREKLLEELGKMDFLVNIENISTVQSPSKLIDYALLGKPILSINPEKLDIKIIEEFLAGNYSNRLIIENIEQYDIRNVAQKFLALYEGKD